MGLRLLTKQEIIAHQALILNVPLVNGDSETLLGECLTGSMFAVGGFDGEELKGLAVLKSRGSTIWIYALHGVNQTQKFKEEFFQFLVDNGVRKIMAVSDRNESAYTRLLGLKKVYSTYERDL